MSIQVLVYVLDFAVLRQAGNRVNQERSWAGLWRVRESLSSHLVHGDEDDSETAKGLSPWVDAPRECESCCDGKVSSRFSRQSEADASGEEQAEWWENSLEQNTHNFAWVPTALKFIRHDSGQDGAISSQRIASKLCFKTMWPPNQFFLPCFSGPFPTFCLSRVCTYNVQFRFIYYFVPAQFIREF